MPQHNTPSSKSLSPARLGLSEATAWPQFISLDQSGDSVELLLRVNPELDYFNGHFAEQAVLPGVVQIHWAAQLAQHFFQLGEFVASPSVKFNSMVLPDTELTLELKFSPAKQQARFSFYNADHKFSSGSLQFGGGAE